jgi:hypothetical protein
LFFRHELTAVAVGLLGSVPVFTTWDPTAVYKDKDPTALT